jgi:hypothetical protein
MSTLTHHLHDDLTLRCERFSGERVHYVEISDIKPSPENDDIYGAIDPKDLDFINLQIDIAENGVREAIQVSMDGFIVSGHRRYKAATEAGLESVPVIYRALRRLGQTEAEWKRVLRAFNHQRVKSASVRLRETLLDVDPDLAYRQLITDREVRERDAPPRIEITGRKVRSGVSDRKQEFLQACINVINSMQAFWPVSDRRVHYALLNDPPLRNSSSGSQRARYGNGSKSYGDLTDMLTRARLAGQIPWEAI